MAHTFASLGERKLVSQAVETEIEEAIRKGDLEPGAKLPSELKLCEQFGVSRTAVREAVRMLSARGLVSIEKGRGMFVTKLSADSVAAPLELYLHMHQDGRSDLDVIRARQLIEPPIAAQAALHHSQDDAEKLKTDVEELKAYDGKHTNLSNLDMTFHLHIAQASQNPVVPLLVEPIHRLMPRIKTAVYGAVDNAKSSAVEWHGKILESILARDAEAAKENMLHHLKVAEKHVAHLQEAQSQSDAE